MHFKKSVPTWLQGDNNPTIHTAVIVPAQCRKDVFNPSILYVTSAHTTVQWHACCKWGTELHFTKAEFWYFMSTILCCTWPHNQNIKYEVLKIDDLSLLEYDDVSN